MNRAGFRNSFLFFFLLTSSGLWARDLYRIVYSSDQAREDAYGAKLIVIPENATPPKHPREVDGIIIYNDYDYDHAWVKPIHEEDKLVEHFQPVVEALGEKWAEYQFVSTTAPELAPPPMKLGSHFYPGLLDRRSVTNRRLANFEKLSAKEQTALVQEIEVKLAKVDPALLTGLAARIRAEYQAEAFIKLRAGFHSEGNVPKTHKDLAAIWKGYLKETRPKIKALLAKQKLPPLGVTDAQLEVQNEIWNWEYIEGSVLEEFLLDPSRVVVQKRIKIAKEVRLHVVEGEILEGATFLRMYEPVGKYLTKEEIARWEKEFQEKFLDQLPAKYRPFTASPDVVLDADTGTLRILDLNPGYESGYLFPEEDLMTTQLFAEHYTKIAPPFLDAFRRFEHARREDQGELLKGLRTDYKEWVYGTGDDAYEHESFWDRVLRHEIDQVITADRREETVAWVMEQFWESGLRSPTIYYQFLNEVQTEWGLPLPETERKHWVTRLRRLVTDQALSLAVDQKDRAIVITETKE